MLILVKALLLSSLGVTLATGQATEPTEPVQAWEHVHRWLKAECSRMSEDLQVTHAVLMTRAEAEDPALLARLDPEPPRPLPSGYGVLPDIAPDPRNKPAKPREWRYSLKTLSAGFVRDFRDAAILAGRVGAESRFPLGEGVEEYERLLASLRNIEEHLSYHEWWQRSVPKDLEYFASRNRIIAMVRELEKLRASKGDEARIAELELSISDAVAPFKKSQSLRIEAGEGGQLVLPVQLHTDIQDEEFLGVFLAGVEHVWNGAEAMKERRLRISLEIVRHEPEGLYPEGPPAREAKIDVSEHLDRFPEGALVLTTGGDSTHARQARHVLLGPAPISRLTLAHEFGHLLGFNDAYLRGYEGELGGAFGVVLIEWRNLRDDLMGLSGSRAVSPEMVDRLLVAYGDG